jgi:hypothetical protein
MYKIKSVKVLYVGMYDEKKLIELAESLDPSKQEGYVVRVYDEFKYDDFNTHVAKYVRENHVQTSQHWLHQQIVKNQLNR